MFSIPCLEAFMRRQRLRPKSPLDPLKPGFLRVRRVFVFCLWDGFPGPEWLSMSKMPVLQAVTAYHVVPRFAQTSGAVSFSAAGRSANRPR